MQRKRRIPYGWQGGMDSGLRAPFMTLSFMALLVIPELKLSDQGLFDSRRFERVPIYVGAAEGD